MSAEEKNRESKYNLMRTVEPEIVWSLISDGEKREILDVIRDNIDIIVPQYSVFSVERAVLDKDSIRFIDSDLIDAEIEEEDWMRCRLCDEKILETGVSLLETRDGDKRVLMHFLNNHMSDIIDQLLEQ